MPTEAGENWLKLAQQTAALELSLPAASSGVCKCHPAFRVILTTSIPVNR